ncbi:hypothetical protein N5C66_03710 [Rhizobium pusense]|uniref:Uncharacterized protein n=1 Tax=Agrobacterium genomosp. 2 str. CFBP 5494 TaxID=1183436 RepID=A0A9W5AXX3_9HYPH|nr:MULTISPECIES: hypothetical protein [Rhizobium/Agrobacterium group]MDH0908424.1 hypothetical protein [Agrobacterium pusense]MDH1094256.1 hypothetical protein [Agrobacterium pusense]MDH1110838.1 hypothetical protein [Agrobacterium pusense]MDH2192158.1 hypothetical protein [Agrobacterium pusense]CAD7043534.1 hypothetical protein RP007_01036 [Rhizobium sp. P007]
MKFQTIKCTSAEDVAAHVRAMVEKNGKGGTTATANEMGVRYQAVSQLVNGRELPNPQILDHLGLEKRIVYVRKDKFMEGK